MTTTTDADFDNAREETSAYGRLTSTHTLIGNDEYLPERRLLIGERSYNCTVTIDEYYGCA